MRGFILFNDIKDHSGVDYNYFKTKPTMLSQEMTTSRNDQVRRHRFLQVS